TYGWPLVSILVLCIAASMAELASAYPTAGGLYFWAHRLGGHRWAWVTAWFNMIGHVTITAGIDYAAANTLLGALNRIVGTTLPTDTTGTVIAMVVIMIPQVLINVFGIRLTARLNDFSVWWHIGGVLVIAVLLTAFGQHTQPAAFLFSAQQSVDPAALGATFTVGPFTFDSIMLRLPGMAALYASGGVGLAFVLGLLQAQWTYTGYDASAHVAEETVMARLNSAWGVFLSVAVSAVVGYIVLMVLTLSITDIPSTATDPYPVLKIASDNLTPFLANLVAVIIAGAMWLCGLASITSMSRMWFAFARDGGMPGHGFIRKIHPKWRTPVNSILVTCTLAVVMLLWSGAFYVVTAISVVFLYWAYGIPILLNLRNRLRRRGEFTTPETAPWNLGRWSLPLNVISVLWIALISIFLVLPPNELVLWTTLLICLFM